MCLNCLLNRREFVASLGVAAAVGVAMGAGAPAASAPLIENFQWNPDKPFVQYGKPLVVQPVLMYRNQPYRPMSSYKSWSRINSPEAAAEEAARINSEMLDLQARSEFPVQILPLKVVTTQEETDAVHQNDYDVVLFYPATGWGDLFAAATAKHARSDTIVFVRHKNGPIYYWYEALSHRQLVASDDPILQKNSAADHGPVTVDDVVVDDYNEVISRLRALYAVKNFIGHRIVTLGPADGKYDSSAPGHCRESFEQEIIEVSYDDFTARFNRYRENPEIMALAEKWTDQYLAMPHTLLETDRDFIVGSFLVYGVFKDYLRENDASTITVRGCMGTIFGAANTTACLALTWLNDEGYLGLCESDFVLVPAAILMRHIANKPVFMHNSTFPHRGMVTCAHCTSPQRMDGQNYCPVRIMTHYESDFGASPKVDFPIGQKVTFLDPHYTNPRWLTFTGTVDSNPFFEICRSQQDVLIDGDWKRLLAEARDSHWTMIFGDYKNEVEYASRKIGINCVRIDG